MAKKETTEKVVFSVKNLLEKTTKDLKTNAGRSESIYKKEIFEGVENKKNLRSKLRKTTENFAKSILAETNETKLKSLIDNFVEYYNGIYLTNDFSVNSICSNNTDNDTKELYSKMFAKIANIKE